MLSETTFTAPADRGYLTIEEVFHILEPYANEEGWDYRIETRGFAKQRIKRLIINRDAED